MRTRSDLFHAPSTMARLCVAACTATLLLAALVPVVTRAPAIAATTTASPARVRAIGDAISPEFDLDLGPGFHPWVPGGFSNASALPFDLFLGPRFAPFTSGGFTSAQSITFDAWLGRFHEGRALSDPYGVDTQPPDPAPVATPTQLRAEPYGCTVAVQLTWTDNASDETGFVVERKQGGGYYTIVKNLGPNATSYFDLPPFGVQWTYRVRAVRGPAKSAYTPEATASGGVASGALAQSAGVTINSIGDRKGLRVHVLPPRNADSWAGVKEVTVVMGNSANFTTPLDIQHRTELPVSGEVVFARFEGSATEDRYFRVLFRNACDLEIPAVTGAVGPYRARQAPVLFVHGIWGKAEDWNDWRYYFENYRSVMTDAIPFECSGDKWETWGGGELPRFIERKLAGDWAGFESIDIVAHSQGGLASRYYIERTNAPRRVRKLVMLGTPNHGGNFAKVKDFIGPVVPSACTSLGHGDGAELLRVDSRRLAFLNYGVEDLAKDERTCDGGGGSNALPLEHVPTHRGDTRYYLVAGTASNGVCLVVHGMFCAVRLARTLDPCSGDGVVPWQSVRLRCLQNEQPARQWLDSDLGAAWGVGPLSHDPWAAKSNFVTDRLVSTPLLESAELRTFVAHLLAGDDSDLPASSMGTGPSLGGSALSARRTDEGAPAPLLIASHEDVLTNTPREHAVSIDGCSSFIALVGWHEGAGRVRLRAPDSTVYALADTASVPWLHYESSDTVGYAAFEVTSPTPGRWALIVDSPTAPPVTYTESWVSEGSSYALTLGVPTSGLNNLQAGVVTASLRQGGTGVSAELDSRLEAPDGESVSLLLHDDGVDGDSLAGDLVYSSRIGSAIQDGTYRFRCTARSLPIGASSAERFQEAVFDVAARPSLQISNVDLGGAPSPSEVGRLSELHATLRNLGTVAADSVRVVFQRTLTGDTLAALTVRVAAGDSARIAMLWTPGEPGTHVIRVSATLTRQIEAEPVDDAAEFTLPVAADVNLTGVLSSPPPPAPTILELAQPRPNPFRGVLTLDFAVPRSQHVSIVVYDVQGRCVKRIADEWVMPGRYSRTWDGRDQDGGLVRSGMFFIRLEGVDRMVTRRAVMIR